MDDIGSLSLKGIKIANLEMIIAKALGGLPGIVEVWKAIWSQRLIEEIAPALPAPPVPPLKRAQAPLQPL